MRFEPVPLYWRRKLKILLHNLRVRQPETFIRVKRTGGLFHLTVGGERITIVSISRWSKYRRGIDVQLQKLAQRYGVLPLRDQLSGQTVIDIGANIGEFSLYCERAGARVFAIEPDPVNYAALDQNIAATGVAAFRLALWYKTETLTFYSSVAGADSSLIEPEISSDTLRVNAVALDDFTEQKGIDRIFLIKADAEGAEPEVLRGARATLARTSHVSIDCGPERKGERTFDTCQSILTAAGFETHALDLQKNVLFGRHRSVIPT